MIVEKLLGPTAMARFSGLIGGSHLSPFGTWLQEQGYSEGTIRSYVRGAARLLRWAGATATPIRALTEEADVAARIMFRVRREGSASTRPSSSYSAGGRRFLVFLRERGIVPPPVCPRSKEVVEFEDWLTTRRGLKASTAENYGRVIEEYLIWTGDAADPCQPDKVRDFILEQAHDRGRAKASVAVNALRGYLRYLIALDRCPVGRDAAVPRIARWKLATVPKYLEPEVVDRIIDACDPSSPNGARDRAILLLLANLALRAGDIADMRLGDLRLEEGLFAVSGKGRQERLLPLPQEVGDAVLGYVEHWRPDGGGDAVFLTLRVPHRSITSHVVSQIARRAIQRAGVDAPSRGAHIFRHSAATTLLRKGMPLRSIGALLRHDSIESVAYYAKVDLNLLRTLARPWPTEPQSC